MQRIRESKLKLKFEHQRWCSSFSLWIRIISLCIASIHIPTFDAMNWAVKTQASACGYGYFPLHRRHSHPNIRCNELDKTQTTQTSSLAWIRIISLCIVAIHIPTVDAMNWASKLKLSLDTMQCRCMLGNQTFKRLFKLVGYNFPLHRLHSHPNIRCNEQGNQNSSFSLWIRDISLCIVSIPSQHSMQ